MMYADIYCTVGRPKYMANLYEVVEKRIPEISSRSITDLYKNRW